MSENNFRSLLSKNKMPCLLDALEDIATLMFCDDKGNYTYRDPNEPDKSLIGAIASVLSDLGVRGQASPCPVYVINKQKRGFEVVDDIDIRKLHGCMVCLDRAAFDYHLAKRFMSACNLLIVENNCFRLGHKATPIDAAKTIEDAISTFK